MACLVAFHRRRHTPDLHWFAAARAGIAVAGDDETLFSITLCPQSDPAPLLKNDIPASQTNTLILIGPEGWRQCDAGHRRGCE
jgi:hypothetical protein